MIAIVKSKVANFIIMRKHNGLKSFLMSHSFAFVDLLVSREYWFAGMLIQKEFHHIILNEHFELYICV